MAMGRAPQRAIAARRGIVPDISGFIAGASRIGRLSGTDGGLARSALAVAAIFADLDRSAVAGATTIS